MCVVFTFYFLCQIAFGWNFHNVNVDKSDAMWYIGSTLAAWLCCIINLILFDWCRSRIFFFFLFLRFSLSIYFQSNCYSIHFNEHRCTHSLAHYVHCTFRCFDVFVVVVFCFLWYMIFVSRNINWALNVNNFAFLLFYITNHHSIIFCCCFCYATAHFNHISVYVQSMPYHQFMA